MFLENGVIIENKNMGDKYYLMKVKAVKSAAAAKAGQFYMIKCHNGIRILGRPISIHYADQENHLLEFYYEVVGEGTKEFTNYKIGEEIRLQGPLGTGFDTEVKGKKVLVVGGGMGMAPLKYLVESVKNKNTVTIIAAGRDAGAVRIADNYHFPKEDIFFATDDGTVGMKGNAVDAMKEILSKEKYDIVYTCGPHKMMEAVAKVAAEHNMRCQISLEEKMACGVKACVGCSIKTREGMKRVCADGPVFEAEIIVDVNPKENPGCSCGK
ncbi:dihydroorotate dehydrogenase electron transfer subunit [uncultured Ilyobacter sp.]|uniref:dihydroorotate dehydrogenase electron transfer subunit n=1 Tax=uncultured Ilyobacter sp. TaxID=544433 RepID=UPI0029F5299B|nr:dihydroorotate dehydrogenase electron transfer subunit [uncultured Ilyobacter sp.]